MAQGGETPPPDLADILPEDLTGYLGLAIITGFASWWLGGGMSFLQMTINNIAIKAGYAMPSWMNTALAFAFTLIVAGILLAVNLVPAEVLAGYEAQYDLVRGAILLILAYGGNQARYYGQTRAIQAERRNMTLMNKSVTGLID